MPYTTTTFYSNSDRWILDIRSVSIFLWKKRRFWTTFNWYYDPLRGGRDIGIGPLEIVLHPRRSKVSDRKRKEINMDMETALGIAARIWCDPDYEHMEMDGDLAERIAVMLKDAADAQALREVLGASLFDEVKEAV